MAIIVRRKQRNSLFILVGSGYGSYRSETRNNGLNPNVAEGEDEMVAVCDLNGAIGYFSADAMEIVSVDGETPRAVLEAAQRAINDESRPGS